jgi:hypothetical protein
MSGKDTFDNLFADDRDVHVGEEINHREVRLSQRQCATAGSWHGSSTTLGFPPILLEMIDLREIENVILRRY